MEDELKKLKQERSWWICTLGARRAEPEQALLIAQIITELTRAIGDGKDSVSGSELQSR